MRVTSGKKAVASPAGRTILHFLRIVVVPSALISIAFTAPTYFFRYWHFHQEDIWITFAVFILCLSAIVGLGVIKESIENRKRARKSGW